MEIVRLNESEFRQEVARSIKEGNFKGDPHKMQVGFKLHKKSEEFVAIAYKEFGEIIGFCGIDIFVASDKVKKGMIHCLGVVQKYRGRGLSVDLLKDIEQYIPKDTKQILSICNPISTKSHQKAGYIITNPGRLSSTGKLMQIRLAKDL